MRGCFYGEEPPSFDDILRRLTELELEIGLVLVNHSCA
jgi:hypothetical protein